MTLNDLADAKPFAEQPGDYEAVKYAKGLLRGWGKLVLSPVHLVAAAPDLLKLFKVLAENPGALATVAAAIEDALEKKLTDRSPGNLGELTIEIPLAAFAALDLAKLGLNASKTGWRTLKGSRRISVALFGT